MTSKGKLSKRDLDCLNRAWGILSDWTEIIEERTEGDPLEDYTYENAMAAVVGLCEFINSYEER